MKPKPVIIVLCFNCLICVSCNVNPACECVVYESSGSSDQPSQGTFTSPNFPQIYPNKINCILYTFLGALNEIVELTFLEFDLQVPITNKCTDYIRFFLNLMRPEVNEASEHNYDLCGNISMIEKKHYSSGRALIFEFHTDDMQQNNIGFRGRYKFLNKTQYLIQGCNARWGPDCTYDCRSGSNNNRKSNTGIIFSPSYPQNYPPNKFCQYYFNAKPHERVKVVFTAIQLEPIDGSCEKSPDSITVYDGTDSLAPQIAQYCNTVNRIEVISSGKDLLIQFKSDELKQRQGFAATFEFVDDTITTTSTFRTLPQGKPWDTTSTTPTKAVVTMPPCSDDASECEEIITSTRNPQGVIQSRNFPNDYPEESEYRFQFMGEKNERVQLEFEVINLYAQDDDVECGKNENDRVEVLIKDSKNLKTFCGHKSKDLLLMSDSNRMDVILVTLLRNENSTIQKSVKERGFKAKYRFVTDFGITSGQQRFDGPGECIFEFQSTSFPNGTFTSPNSPGLYPRNTECHYLFYGQKSERIHISFVYFDVDGIPPQCEEGTDSDQVSFSNFNVGLEDEKMPPLCGVTKEYRKKGVVSDKNFFRVTFKSNHKYDATGFEAYFQFRKPKDNFGSRSGQISSSPSLSCPTLLVAVIVLLLTCS